MLTVRRDRALRSPRALNFTCENCFVSNTHGSIIALESIAVEVGKFVPVLFPFVTTFNLEHEGGLLAALTVVPSTVCSLLSIGLCYWLLVVRSTEGKSMV